MDQVTFLPDDAQTVLIQCRAGFVLRRDCFGRCVEVSGAGFAISFFSAQETASTAQAQARIVFILLMLIIICGFTIHNLLR